MPARLHVKIGSGDKRLGPTPTLDVYDGQDIAFLVRMHKRHPTLIW
jgi:hypothetical protein